jgi:hypothetical protein
MTINLKNFCHQLALAAIVQNEPELGMLRERCDPTAAMAAQYALMYYWQGLAEGIETARRVMAQKQAETEARDALTRTLN